MTEPCRRTCPEKAGHRPEPSVAWSRSDPSCEAYTGSIRAARSSLESINRESWRFIILRQQHRDTVWPGVSVSPGSKSAAPVHVGSPGTWEVLLSPSEHRRTPVNKSWPDGSAPLVEERTGATLGSGRAKATKRGATGTRKSESSIVPMKQGNARERTLWREGKASEQNRWRERCQEHQALIPSHRDCSG